MENRKLQQKELALSVIKKHTAKPEEDYSNSWVVRAMLEFTSTQTLRENERIEYLMTVLAHIHDVIEGHLDKKYFGVAMQDLKTALFGEHSISKANVALQKINEIRNSIVGLQCINWSEHIYPLVAALNEAGYSGLEYPEARENFGTMLERTKRAEARVTELETLLKEVSSSFDANDDYRFTNIRIKKTLNLI